MSHREADAQDLLDLRIAIDRERTVGYRTLYCKVTVSPRQGLLPVQKILLPIALLIGLLIAYVDSRPNWDDAGITALALLVSAGVFGLLSPDRPWMWALAVGLWIPLYGIASTRNFGSLLALVFAFVGAYAGMAIRRSLVTARPKA